MFRTRHLRKLVDEMLTGAGCHKFTFLPDYEAATLQLRYGGKVGFILCEAGQVHKDHLNLARFLRWDPASPNPSIPLIAYGEQWTALTLRESRDAGISDIIAFPTTIHGFNRRFMTAVCNVPPFIKAETYRGPDRRKTLKTPYAGPKRRAHDQVEAKAAQKPVSATAQADLYQMLKGKE